jgi:hypothetical protein
MMKTIVLAAALALGVQAPVLAQSTSTPAKKELIAKVLQAQQPAFEIMARQMVEQPAMQLLQRAGQYIQARIPADKREGVARDVQAEARKYVDETYPFVRERALRLAPSTVGVVMDEQMSEDELRQILAIFESPAWRKFQGMGAEMQKALADKLVADVKDEVEPKVRSLDVALAKRLGVPTTPASGAGKGK